MSDDPRVLAAQLLAQSRFALPLSEARAQMDARRKQLLASPVAAPVSDPDFAPAPLPIVDDPSGFAAEFWAKRKVPPARKKSPTKRPGRKPVGNLDDRHQRFTVIPGSAGGDNEDEGAV